MNKFQRTIATGLSVASLLGCIDLQAAQQVGTRQIHLDFHTSEHIPDIGAAFSKEQFQQALKVANVNAINIFAKGHHSWSYYPTQVGQMHPQLDFDLLGAQVEACHEIGVLCPFYFTFGWSHNDAVEHPEWCARDRKGNIRSTSRYNLDAKPEDPKPNYHWMFMCVNSSYHDHIMAQIEELCMLYDVDGFWFDIYQTVNPCFCDTCRKMMKEQGYDAAKDSEAEAFYGTSFKRHFRALKELIHSHHPDASVYFNGTTTLKRGPANFNLKMYEENTVQDLEDLPTMWGGYDKLPIQAKLYLKAGYTATAMSGKFHKAWGEFGGFKHPNALKYEASSMISWGVNCNFGDQLHPNGKMDMDTYKNIGVAYEYVEKIEDYGVGGLPEARVGLWRSFNAQHDEGVSRMLLESHVNFNIANIGDDGLSAFDVIIVPGVPCINEEEAVRLNQYVADGGKLLVIGEGALDAKREKLRLDIGAEYVGSGTVDQDYFVVGDPIAEKMVRSPVICYEPALRIKPAAGTEVLAAIREPYFNRTYGRFSSHLNTPYKLEDAEHPAMIRKGNVVFIAHELDKLYYVHGAQQHRQLFANALNLLHERPMIETKLPSAGRMNLLHQKDQKRYVAHLLYGPPITRGECEVIEDLPTLYDVPITFDLPVAVKKAVLVPAMQELEIMEQGGKRSVTVPEFSCHCAVSFEYD